MIAQLGETHIRKMRVISSERDALSLRLRIAGALSAVDLHPASLPRSAIACIHKLSDPLPGALRFERGTTQLPREWERALAESLDRVVRRAARPALGNVPINAEAVVFLDPAELLECFASDWLEGAAAMRWWWRSIFETTDTATALVRAWLEAPEYAPVALARLANTGKAAAFVGSLSAGDSRLMFTGITRRFALRDLAAAFDVVLNDSGATTQERIAPGAQPASSSAHPSQSPPWCRWLNETEEQELEIGQKSLLATGLMLVRAPAAVRSRAFAEEVVSWHQAATTTAGAGEAKQSYTPVTAIQRTAADGDLSRQSPYAVTVEQNPRPGFSDAVRLAVQPSARRDDSGNSAELVTAITDRSDEVASSRLAETALEQFPSAAPAQPPTIPLPDQSSKSSPQPEIERSTKTKAASVESSLGPPLDRSATINASVLLTVQCLRSEPMFEAEIETQLGGIFYLINLGLFLNLYGDFTTPAQPGIDLLIWDFIALVGTHLAGEEIRGDPVWSLLARLSGRDEDDPPGKEFAAPESWRLPEHWLASFEEGRLWQWERSGDRLRVRHPEGFLVVDVPTEGDPVEQLARETREYRGVAGFEFCSESSQAEGHTGSKLERWLGWLMPYIRARLSRALGLRGMRSEHVGAALPVVLLEHQARVVATATHLDVFFSLDEHPIEIRLAGLDRNAGWVPSAGRYVTFHYE